MSEEHPATLELHRAIGRSATDLPGISRLLDEGARPQLVFDGLGRPAMSALTRAVQRGNAAIVQLLLERYGLPQEPEGEPICFTAADGYPFRYEGQAKVYERVEIMRSLTRAGADPTATGHAGLTPLMAAMRRRNPELALYLLEDPRVQVEPPPESRVPTPLMWAAMCGLDACVSAILDRGADPGRVLRDPDTDWNVPGLRRRPYSALNLALAERHEAIAKLLEARGAVTKKPRRRPLGQSPYETALRKWARQCSIPLDLEAMRECEEDQLLGLIVAGFGERVIRYAIDEPPDYAALLTDYARIAPELALEDHSVQRSGDELCIRLRARGTTHELRFPCDSSSFDDAFDEALNALAREHHAGQWVRVPDFLTAVVFVPVDSAAGLSSIVSRHSREQPHLP